MGENMPRAKEILKTFCHHANIATLIHHTCTSALNILQIPLFNMWCQPSAFILEIPNNLHIVCSVDMNTGVQSTLNLIISDSTCLVHLGLQSNIKVSPMWLV